MRYDNAYGYQSGLTEQAASHPVRPGAESSTAERKSSESEYEPIRVTGKVTTARDPVVTGVYSTVVIPASSAGSPSVAQLLPRDLSRHRAYIQPVDAAIVISTVEQECYSTANVAADFPNGGYMAESAWSPPIFHQEAVYATNTSTSGACRVVVLTERY